MSEHEHAHEHEHHHNYRESFDIPLAEVFLEAHMHDQAATVSMALCPREGESIPFTTIVDAMSTIGVQAEAIGGIIGHIKGFAKEGDAFAHASVTDASIAPALEGDPAYRFGEEADIQLVAIVLLVGQDELIRICKAALSA